MPRRLGGGDEAVRDGRAAAVGVCAQRQDAVKRVTGSREGAQDLLVDNTVLTLALSTY